MLSYYASTLFLEGIFVLRNSFYKRIFCGLGLNPFTNLLCSFRDLRKGGKVCQIRAFYWNLKALYKQNKHKRNI